MAARTVTAETRLAGVIGWPVSHSRSPQMHNAAYAALGLNWVYLPLAVPPSRLLEAIGGLPALGFAGANVTIPHKQKVSALCHQLTPQASRAGSVNTVLVREDGSLLGDTTDGAGMLDAIGATSGRSALVLGAGGAARAGVAALLDAGFDVTICARRDDAARRLAGELGGRPQPWPAQAGESLLVNATPVGQSGDPSELPVGIPVLETAEVVCDLAYRGDGVETGLVVAARRAGVRIVDGLDVLIGQGARSFRIFTGAEPPVDVMRAAVRTEQAGDTTLDA